jgi:hypothetical protein
MVKLKKMKRLQLADIESIAASDGDGHFVGFGHQPRSRRWMVKECQ